MPEPTTAHPRTEARRRSLAMFARLADAADAAGLSMNDISRLTGLRANTLSEWRRGTARLRGGPSYGDLDLIAEALGARLCDFADAEPPDVEARMARALTELHRLRATLARLADEPTT